MKSCLLFFFSMAFLILASVLSSLPKPILYFYFFLFSLSLVASYVSLVFPFLFFFSFFFKSLFFFLVVFRFSSPADFSPFFVFNISVLIRTRLSSLQMLWIKKKKAFYKLLIHV